jgi:hypothetical protein
MSAFEAFFRTLFTKVKVDVEAEIASPNLAALHTIAYVALAAFLLFGTLALDPVKLGYLVHTTWVFLIVHPTYKLGIAFLNAWKGTSVHGDKASVAVAATSPATGAVPIVPPVSLPAK